MAGRHRRSPQSGEEACLWCSFELLIFFADCGGLFCFVTDALSIDSIQAGMVVHLCDLADESLHLGIGQRREVLVENTGASVTKDRGIADVTSAQSIQEDSRVFRGAVTRRSDHEEPHECLRVGSESLSLDGCPYHFESLAGSQVFTQNTLHEAARYVHCGASANHGLCLRCRVQRVQCFCCGLRTEKLLVGLWCIGASRRGYDSFQLGRIEFKCVNIDSPDNVAYIADGFSTVGRRDTWCSRAYLEAVGDLEHPSG
mgnify:CR=1 FL=1